MYEYEQKRGIVIVDIRNGNTFILAYNFGIKVRYILGKELLIMFVVQYTVS